MKKTISSLILFFTLSIFVSFGCQEEADTNIAIPAETVAQTNSCEGCHTNYDHLKKVYTPEEPSTEESHGCGGPPPYYEPYDRVYLGGDGYNEFKSGIHGQIGCVGCHNGVEGTSDKTVAHSGSFTAKPSLNSEDACGKCHPTIVARAKNSLHEQGWGQKAMVVRRSGTGTSPTDFHNLSDLMKEGYTKNCMKCHATCGDCHIVRPNAKGGGLESGHNFVKTPDMRETCVGCHESRGGHAYFGMAIGTKPDIHLSEAGFNCMDCHSKNEVHGDGNIYDQRYKMPLLPSCEDCHNGLETVNPFHTKHFDSFNCQTCHSQDYNNCGSCHIGGEGARIASHQKFKIGLNPIPETKPYRLATVRESLSAPDSWANYGIDNLSNFDVAPTYKYTTPHNIQRWTTRTTIDTVYDSSQPDCAQSCHIVKNSDDGSYINKEYYLFDSDLLDWEKNATKNVVVDGQLPLSWGTDL
ncbi:MAG: hypothetical protein K9J12_15910 [Melioribacteraceae bacterium]|nr:hypothetical protein [Melioribacteraceae bacterium]MCF8263671.1 hypothetical protein [Melioribacteraceae bacterium]